jgi:DNA-binding CsgD family transcriptional regulator
VFQERANQNPGRELKVSKDPALPEWPFVERRRTDRRKGDRRRAGELDSHKAARLCTARERQALALVLLGMTNKQIAQDLRITEDTVKKHLQHIYRKVGVHRRALLIIGAPPPK